MSKSRRLTPFLTFIFLLCIAWLVSPTQAQAQVTNYGCNIASPPHVVRAPADTRIVGSPSDCVSGETWISWETFPAGGAPIAIEFDGTNLWVINGAACFTCPGSVTKFRASDGANLGTFPAGQGPERILFDGTDIWITNRSANRLLKLRASDGAIVANIPVRPGPYGLAFDGTNLWVAYYLNSSVSRLRPSDGVELANTPGVSSPLDLVFDGANIWAANNLNTGTVTKIRGSDGAILGVFNTNGRFPWSIGFDGSSVWVSNSGSQNISKFRASDGALVSILVSGHGPGDFGFDGANMWIPNEDLILKYRAVDGAHIGSFPASLPASTAGGAAVFDGRHVWITNHRANTVTRFLTGAVDAEPPTTSYIKSPNANGAGWNNSDVSISLSASDNADGSGVSEITYCATGAQSIPCTTVSGANANFLVTAVGETTITYFATDNANNTEATQTLVVKIDKSAPSVSCGSSDGQWHVSDVAIPCSADDGVSGLADSGDSSFDLTTSVAANTETANASTDSRTVCDVAGNCSTAGPVGGNKVDKRAPTITITTPSANAVYLLNQSVSANYTCTDGGSGVASCTGTVVNGGQLDTATAGAKTFTVNATDNVGNNATPSIVNYTVNFGIEVLFDQTKAHKSGSTVPVKIRLVDANGVNVSSSATIVHAISVVQIGSQASPLVEDAGNANPDLDFRYDQSLDGYIFNLKTTGYGTGSYLLNFVVGNNTTVYSVGFQVRQ